MGENLEIKYEKARDGHETLKIDGYYLHSKYAPIKEAQRFAKERYQPHHLHIVFGYGLGYIVDALINQCHFHEPILLIDPLIDQGLLKMKKHSYERLYYVPMTSLEVVENIADKLGSYTPNILFIPSINYNHIALDSLQKIAELVRDVQQKQITNINTSGWFAMLWQMNYIFNLPYTSHDLSLNVLNKYYDKPVVIASGGPSLTKQLPFLQKYRDQVILICAGSAINSLLKFDIEPDYIVSVDGGEPNFNHFKNLNLKNSQLIYSPMMHYGIRPIFQNDAFVFIPHVRPGLKRHLQERFHRDFPIISGGGSVAHFALSIAKYITTGPICLIGQDLAYTNHQSHAEGNRCMWNNAVGNLSLDGYDGQLVNSTSQFKIMINTFNEMQVLEPHDNKVFNCTEGGAKLKNYEQISFLHFLECYSDIKINLYKPINKIIDSNDFSIEKEFDIYEEILDYLRKGKRITEKELGPVFTTKGIQKLKLIEKNLNRLYKDTCLDMLLEPNIVFAEHQFLPKIDETKEQEFKRVKAYILQLYTSCQESIENYIAKVKSLLKERTYEGN